MSNTCTPLHNALKDRLLHSDCVLKEGHLPSECLRDHTKELPEQCLALRQALFECKKSMVSVELTFLHASFLTDIQLDMRKRFRGNNAGAIADQYKVQGHRASSTA